MQKFFLRFLMLLAVIVAGAFHAQAETVTPRKGVIRVKLQPEVAVQVGATPRIAAHGTMLETGVQTLNASAKAVNAVSMKRVFPYNARFESQMAQFGLDRWYEVSFDESINPQEAQRIFSQTAGVQVATMKVPMVMKEGNGEFTTVSTLASVERPSTMPFNDPRLSQQWHYNNTGLLSGSVAGADINLFEAWKTTTGKKDVIVAIIDGGIDYEHEDLAGNVMLNSAELNGQAGVDDDQNGYIDDVYGWNFCTNSAQIYPHDHGTHVAGTVAAVNNNGIGVCGIAGGDGTSGSGVSMISCQVFDSRSGSGYADYAAAIVYAANRGASIANCSWGWSTNDYYEQDVLDAIDYFVAMTRSDKLTGGVMFFATGNDGATGNFYPACYDKVVAVGSMTNDYTVATYSNYGSWVDIVAPGGLLDYGEAGGVLSTLPNNEYGFNEGTSMATPHVTGVAALFLSAHGNADMINETLRQQILTSVNDLYAYNPGKEGLHGSGYIDAAKALMIGDGSAPEAVAAITALPAQDNITLGWIIPASSDNNVNYHMLYYSTEPFDATTNLKNLSNVVVDTKFLSSGDSCTYELTGLKPLTTYYLALKAVNRWGDASALSPVVSATTNAGPKMTVSKTSLSLKVNATTPVGSATFQISNDDEGLLKWSAYTRTTNSSIAKYSIGDVTPGLTTKFNGKLAVKPFAANEVFNTADFVQSEYPINYYYFTEYYASIGESDVTLPNSQATWFYVDPDKYPEGFNLTGIKIQTTYGKNPTLQVYNGSGSMNSGNLLAEITPASFYSNGIMRLDEQIYFAPGESFWIAAHFPAQENAYTLGLATTDNTEAPAFCFMSNDMGNTWTLLADALKGSPYEALSGKAVWAMTAVSQNPDWSTLITLSPAEGSVKYGETQDVTIANDGQPIPNGTYKFNLRFKTNESEANTTVIPVTLSVTGQKPQMSPAKIVNFGNLLVGESKTLTIEVYNEGYGPFGYYGSLSGKRIVCDSEHFTAPTNISGGFPARQATQFDVTFNPKAAGSITGVITFKHSDGTEFKVTLTGVATDPSKIVIEPDVIDCDTLDVAAAATTKEFTIKNEGNYPLEYVFPKFSDQQLESQGSAAHRFGYVAMSNINGDSTFVYDGNPALIGGVDITSKFDDNNYLSGAIDLGFAFPFYGKSYERIYITSYGGVAFGLGEYAYRAPLTESSYGLEGVPYISAYGYQLAIGPDSKIEYAKQDGKFVINFSNVLGLVYDQDYTPISFRITLASNGDIEIFYDNYEAASLFQDGSTLYCGILDGEGADPLSMTSADVADYWGNNDDPAGDVYKYFTTTSAVKFTAPKANFITALAPAYGIVNPGESTTITATLQANGADMIAGETYNRLVVMSNDPVNSTSYVQFNATITGESLVPAVELASDSIAFGEVFRTSVAQRPLTIKNTGTDSLTVTSVYSTTNAVTVDFANEFKLPAGLSKDIIVTLPTDNEGEVSDNIIVETGVDTLSVPVSGTVIGCPTIDLSYTEITDSIVSGTELKKPLTITNNGNETLVYSVTPNPEYIEFSDSITDGASVSYSYTASVDGNATQFNWIDIETTGLGEQNNFTYYNNNDFVEVELPFTFPYFGKEYNKMYIYNTGFVSFTKRDDQKIWPEPPGEFPAGTIYTNIIAPYWGLHTCDQSKTAGTYHYMTENEVVVSWMEYGNSMNMGVCYQLIMKKDGSFKFQYKGFGDYAIIYSTFGLAGLSNEDGSVGIRIPERYIAFGNAVQFFPVVESSIAAGESKTIDIDVLTDKMAGEYNTNIVVNSNVPGAEKIEIPVNLNIIGVAKPVFPDTIIVQNVMGTVDDAYKGPLTQMGAFYEAYFKIENQGTAPFYVTNIINEGVFSIYDSWFDEYTQQPAQTWYYGESEDWYTGEIVKGWMQYYDSTPVTVGKDGLEISIPIMQGSIESTPGTYDVPLKIAYNEADTANILVRFIVTNAPYLVTDKAEIRVENAASDFVGVDSVVIYNYGQYPLTYELRLDPTGVGEEISAEDSGNAGIAPWTLSTEAANALSQNLKANVQTFATSTSVLDTPQDFEHNNALFYPAMTGSTTTYQYGTGNTYGVYKAATYYEAPAEGFNISHIYTAVYVADLTNVDITVEIINGDNVEGETVLGKGTYHIDSMETANFILIPLDRAVYMNPGQKFYVVITYPAGVEYPAYLAMKEEGVESNRYMGWVEGYGWFDVATMFENQVGSVGYIMTCLETVAGDAWVKMLNDTKTGEINPGESVAVSFRLSAADAPLDKGNKAVLVVKSNDVYNPVLNFPIYLDKNAGPTITVPSEVIYVKEGETTQVEFTVVEPDADDFSIRFDDSGAMSNFDNVAAIDSTETVEIELDGHNNANVLNTTAGVKVTMDITPDYGSAGNYTMTISATDTLAHESQAVIRYYVEHVNRAPVAVETEPIVVYIGSTSEIISFDALFEDPDGDEMTYTVSVTNNDIVTCYTSATSAILVGNVIGNVAITVIATDASGAVSANTVEVFVKEQSGIENISIDSKVSIYPNPVVETLYVTCDFAADDVTYSIYGENGALLYNVTETAEIGSVKAINVANLADGLYLLKVTADGKTATYPIIKK